MEIKIDFLASSKTTFSGKKNFNFCFLKYKYKQILFLDLVLSANEVSTFIFIPIASLLKLIK